MADYLSTYGTVSQQLREAIDFLSMIRAKVKGKCFGPNRALQEEVRKLYESEVGERLQLIARLIIELGQARPPRFAVGLSRLTLNLGDTAEQMPDVLYIPGYRNLLKVAVAQIDHLLRCLLYFQRTILQKEEGSVFNVNNLLRDIMLAVCPYRAEFLPPGHEKAVRVSFKSKLDDSVSHMNGDQVKLYMAFFQMVSNAVTAAGDGGTVSVYTKYYEPFHQLQITITDNGPGIDRLGLIKSALLTEALTVKETELLRRDRSDHNNKIFDLAYLPRVSAFDLEGKKHKGMGLCLAREEITRHRGKIEIHSKVDRGVNFQVFFTIK
ncbi:MAG: HAMP domain-containing sensor histidine kinase [Gemmatimonadota bacterium]|nr:HAMP domain-containing sensor histidine kinase [Gemmatimonadota bacterium]